MNADALVVYHGKPARIRSVGKEKIEIVTVDGSAKNVREKDIEFLHRGPVGALNFPAPPVPNWDEMLDLMGGESLSFAEFTELAFGRNTPETAWAAFEELSSGIRFNGSISAGVAPRPPEELLAALKLQEEKNAEKLRRAELVERIRTNTLLPDDRKSLREIELVAKGETENSRLLKELGVESTPEKAHALLLKLGIWPELFNPWPSRFGVPLEAPEIELPELPPEKRVDLTALRALAIDDIGSDDPDDAMSFADGLLYVHIADPGAIVAPDSPADREAAERGSNCYLPESISPMLPEAALPRLGLGLQENSPALTFAVRIGDDGGAKLEKMFLSTIRAERLTYETCGEQAEISPLPELRDALERFRRHREEQGALFIRLPEVKTRVKDGEITITPCPVTPERELIANAMLAAGHAVALEMAERGIAFPFVHQAPPEIPPEEFGNSLPEMFRLRRNCSAGEVLPHPGRHSGLGLEPYARVTSPLRRYTDLLAHQQLRRIISGEEPFDSEYLERKLLHSEEAAAARRKLEKYSNEYFLLIHLRRHPEWEGRGVVVDKQGDRLTILIPEFAYEYKCRMNGRFKIGDEVALRFTAADQAAMRLSLNVSTVSQ